MLAWVWRGGSPGRPLSLVTLRKSVASPASTPASPHGQTPREESWMTRAESWFRGQAENILHTWKICKTRPLQKKIQQTFFQCKPGTCPITSSSPSPLLLTFSCLLAVRETRATVLDGGTSAEEYYEGSRKAFVFLIKVAERVVMSFSLIRALDGCIRPGTEVAIFHNEVTRRKNAGPDIIKPLIQCQQCLPPDILSERNHLWLFSKYS